MALIKTENGFAIEYDCKLRDNKPVGTFKTAIAYNIFFQTIIEAIKTAAKKAISSLLKELGFAKGGGIA